MKRTKSTAAKGTVAKKLLFTALILKMHKSPALVKRFWKNPDAVAKAAGLTAAQAVILKSGSWVKITQHMAKESKLAGAMRIGPLLSPVQRIFFPGGGTKS